jgi:hypothetical protein
MPALHLPMRCKPLKRLLPSDDVEIDPVTPESIAAAQEAMWRERYRFQFEQHTAVTAEGRIILPAHPPQES